MNFRYFSDFLRRFYGVGFSKRLVIEDFTRDFVPLEAWSGWNKVTNIGILHHGTCQGNERSLTVTFLKKHIYIYFILNRFMVSVCV